MSVSAIISNILGRSIHLNRIKSLVPLIESIISTKKMRLTQIGRGLSRLLPSQERSCIRRVDRCLANGYYQKKSVEFYSAITRSLLATHPNPIIVVDWSSLPNTSRRFNEGEHCLLRASLVSRGRGLTLYEEIHPKAYENHPRIHQHFLKQLQKIIPTTCKPCIVTDAGFKNPWFKAVVALGWNFVGRIRGLTHINDGSGFIPVKQLFERIVSKASYLGEFIITKTNPMIAYCYSYKYPLKGHSRYGKMKRDNIARKASRAYREPWVLVSSIKNIKTPNTVIRLYSHRMTIEESFRDLKSSEYGFGLRNNVTLKPERLTVWLMLIAIASLVAFIAGFCIEKAGLHRQFQANSYRHKRTLSLVFLGCQVIKNNKIPFHLMNMDELGLDLAHV
jgi:hypothetical protein